MTSTRPWDPFSPHVENAPLVTVQSPPMVLPVVQETRPERVSAALEAMGVLPAAEAENVPPALAQPPEQPPARKPRKSRTRTARRKPTAAEMEARIREMGP